MPTDQHEPSGASATQAGFRRPVRVLSDLHLGHDASVIGEVVQLRPLLEGASTVIFNGDTIEERAKRFRDRSMVMFGELKELCADLGAEPVFVTGNHDLTVSTHHYLDLSEAGVFVTHGDCLFDLVSPWSRKMPFCRDAILEVVAEYSEDDLDDLDKRMEMTKRAAAKMEMTPVEFERSFTGWVRLFFTEIWPPRRPLAMAGCWLVAPRRAFGVLRRYRPEAATLVVGHTHVPGVWRRRGQSVVNTGGFLALLNARLVEISEGGVFVNRVRRRDGRFVPGGRRRQIR